MVLASFVAAGGLGFINYYVADKLDIIEFNKSNTKIALPFMLMWSIFDFSIYLIVQALCELLKEIPHIGKYFSENIVLAITLMLTICIVFILFTMVARPIFKIINNFINKRRKSAGKAEIESESVWQNFISSDVVTYIYIFNLDGTAIISGISDYTTRSTDNEGLSMSIIPFNGDHKLKNLKEVLDNYATKEGKDMFNTTQFVDLDRKVIIVKTESANPS